MNILFLTPWYPHKNAPYSGTFVREHARAIQYAGNDLHVMAIVINSSSKIFNYKTHSYIDEDGIKTTIVNLSSKFNDILYYNFPVQLFYLLKTIRRLNKQKHLQFDIVHSNVVYPIGVLGYFISKKLKIPHVITEHWSRIKRIMKLPVYAQLCRKAYTTSGAILPVSNFLKQNIQSHLKSIDPDKFQVVGNVINNDTFKFVASPKRKDKNIRFTAIATWNKKKIPDKLPKLFIDALAIISNRSGIDVQLTMIGSGNQINDLKSKCKQHQVKAVFTGFIEKTRIAEILQYHTDFFIHASTIETFSVVTAEALSCGVPVICSDVGALSELVDASNGVLCKNTVEDWVKGIEKAIATTYDGLKISQTMKDRFSYKSIGKQVEQVYIKVTSNNKNI